MLTLSSHIYLSIYSLSLTNFYFSFILKNFNFRTTALLGLQVEPMTVLHWLKPINTANITDSQDL
jgi:hypothetical protein